METSDSGSDIRPFAAISVWLFMALLLFTDLIQEIRKAAYQASKEASSQKINVLIKNNEENRKKEKRERVFLSDSENEAQGRLSEGDRFSALTNDDELMLGAAGNPAIKAAPGTMRIDTLRIIQSDRGLRIVSIPDRKPDPKSGSDRPLGNARETRIPTYYNFQERFALSWDRFGKPVLPTTREKHFEYFRAMINKIRDNWSPPGGPPFGRPEDIYSSYGYAPGRFRYQTFPNQLIKVVFMVNEAGDVTDVKLWSSLGYKSLDASITDAIWRSKNFGPTPEDLLKDGSLIIPFNVQIIFSY